MLIRLIKKYYEPIVVGVVLVIMSVIMVFSSLGDSVVKDEIAYIGAGYSYITTGDYRLDPEQPPLVKDISAILPYIYMAFTSPINFGTTINHL